MDIKDIDLQKLQSMAEAGERIQDCYRVLTKSKTNVVGELIKGVPDFYEWDHYPKGDVFDSETNAQYYYHAHPTEARVEAVGAEHGHFHTFVRPLGMPGNVSPVELSDYKKPKNKNDDICHLVGVSMDRRGLPIRLFTVNRWVTGETWYSSEDVIKILDRFNMDLSWPSWPVNVWLTSMMRLFRPQIEALMVERDQAIAEHQKNSPEVNVFENRNVEVTSFITIDVDKQIKQVKQAIKNKSNV